MKTQAELRAFAYGAISGIAIVAAVFVIVSEIAGVRWQPVKIGATVRTCHRADAPPYNCLTRPVRSK